MKQPGYNYETSEMHGRNDLIQCRKGNAVTGILQ